MITQKEKFHIYILVFIILASYFFGFYLNEDSAGGGKSSRCVSPSSLGRAA